MKRSGEGLAYEWKEFPIRKRKYKTFLNSLFSAVGTLDDEKALGIKINVLPDKLERVRAAINRESMKRDIWVNTSTDDKHFYVALRL